MKKSILLSCLLVTTVATFAQLKQEISIIPKPASLKALPGTFSLSGNTKIYAEPGNISYKQVADMLATEIKEKTGKNIPVIAGNAAGSNSIVITSKNTADSLGTEGYHLAVKNNGIILKAQNANGVFYGIQTILQLLPVTQNELAKATIALPAVEITDKPRFEWRGLMLDCGRYYFSMNFLKKFIDYIAMHKMNTFHWHLTEDHGWRLEIKKYPRLTDIGAWRTETEYVQGKLNGTPTGGYYTQEQARELVRYAAERFVTIVPEIEMPGHSTAALIAYPELSCTGGPFQTLTRWGIQKEIFCAGNEKTFEFLEEVLTEVAAIFPSPVIHMGGDEAPKDRWKACAKCQKRIKDEGLKDEHELQSYFVKRIEKFMMTKNRNIIGWDEILEGGLAANAWVMSWRGTKGGLEAAKQRNSVVMAPNNFYYLDYHQGLPSLEPIGFTGRTINTLERVYSFEPFDKELTPEQTKYIRGVQGNVWGEFIHTPERAEYMTFPRAAAVAETGWTPAALKNWDDFSRRMEKQYQRYELEGINYAKSAYNVWQTTNYDSASNTAVISFKTNSFKPEIRYTLDGNEPTATSKLYTGPFKVTAPVLIKSATFKNGKILSKIYEEAVLKK